MKQNFAQPRLNRCLNWLLAARLTVILAVFLAGAGRAAAADLPTIEEIVASAQKNAKDIKSWGSDIKISMPAMQMEMKGNILARGEMQHSRMDMQVLGQPAKMETIVDKNRIAWTLMDMGIQKMVMKMDMKKMLAAAGSAPGMGMMGGGATTVENPAETLKGLQAMYDLKVRGKETIEGSVEVYAIDGTIKPAFKGAMAQADPTGALGDTSGAMNKVALLVGKNDGLVRKIGYAGDDGTPFVAMEYANLKTNVPAEDKEFEFTPPPGAQVMDMDAMMGGAGGAGGAGGLGALPEPSDEPAFNTKRKSGDKAPDFSASTMDDRKVKLSDNKGKPTLIVFWASDSKPCVEEIPTLVKIYNESHSKGLEIIGVSLDKSKDELTKALKANADMKWPQVFDGKVWKSPIVQIYGVEAIPFTVLIDKAGVIAQTDLRGEDLRAAVKKLVAE